MVFGGEYDAAGAFEGVVQLTIGGAASCSAVLVAQRLALTAASCLLRSAGALSLAEQQACARGDCGDAMVPAAD
eukprot:1695911-Prymnesium_polylepis.1